MSLRLDQLNPQQREAVEHTTGPLLVLAGAGSGKTRVVTCRTARLLERGVNPRTILVVTFTNKAAGEMRERILRMVAGSWGKELTLSTFHAFGAGLLRQYIDRLGYPRNFTILDETDQRRVIRQALQELDLKGTSVGPDQIQRLISLAKREQTTPAGLRDIRFSPLLPFAQRVFSSYQEHLRAMGGVDFDDLLALPLALAASDPSVRAEISGRFEYVMVDEFQDTNAIQLAFLRLLADRGNLMAVGDDDQSIYGFQGARASNILEFERLFPGARILKLEQNYRSVSRILDAANAVIGHNTGRHAKQLWSTRGAGDKVRFLSFADEREEAGFVASDIAAAIDGKGVPPTDLAVLYRVRAQSRLFEEALRMASVPYRVLGSTELFNRAEVRDWLAYLSLMVNPGDELSFRRIVNVPSRGLGPQAVQVLEDLAKANRRNMIEALKQAGDDGRLAAPAQEGARTLSRMLDHWSGRFRNTRGPQIARLAGEYLEDTGLVAHIRQSEKSPVAAQRRIDTLNELIDGMKSLDVQETLVDYLASIRLDSSSPDRDEQRQHGVSLMTLHSAKGLEFRQVYLVGFEKDLIPHQKSLDHPAQIAEERRLCYVGMTRAMDRLTLTAARTRTHREQRMPRQTSMFLKEIPEVLLDTSSDEKAVEEKRTRRNLDYLARIRAMLENGK